MQPQYMFFFISSPLFSQSHWDTQYSILFQEVLVKKAAQTFSNKKIKKINFIKACYFQEHIQLKIYSFFFIILIKY